MVASLISHFHQDHEKQQMSDLMCFQLFKIHLQKMILCFQTFLKQKVVFCRHFLNFVGLTSSFKHYFMRFLLGLHYFDVRYCVKLKILNVTSLQHSIQYFHFQNAYQKNLSQLSFIKINLSQVKWSSYWNGLMKTVKALYYFVFPFSFNN